LNYKEIEISDYLYDLPDEKIAQYPLPVRDLSKLLVYKNQKISEAKFDKLDGLIPQNSLIIFNDTKVIPARMFFYKDTGARIEIFCLEPASNTTDYQLEFHKKDKSVWKCFVGNASKWKSSTIKSKFDIENSEYEISAEVKEHFADEYIVEFKWNCDITFGEILEILGKTPLPPYIRRESESSDKDTYQTVYARIEGSVAAPTAGLHFTEGVLAKLKSKNCKFDYVTLNVGAGTFKPVKSKLISQHKMHSELFYVSRGLIENILNNHDNLIIAVGTTTVRTLESLYWYGVKLLEDKSTDFNIEQWYPYENKNIPLRESLSAVLNFINENKIDTIYGNTELMIVPGYDFKIPGAMITNFHLPGSTLLLLISAFIGGDWKNVYDYALNNDFRFLSYGDSSLLYKK
jgi:S-adenosylmethionine:tRNA ribosyltransferase-isomerase